MNHVIIDVREPNEYAGGHVVGAINMPLKSLLNSTKELTGASKDTPLIVYCRSGNRSSTAVHFLQKSGYKNVTNGINAEQVITSLGL